MPMLVCRRCRSDSTSMEKVATYSRKRLVVIHCKNCDNSWVVSAPKEGNLTEYLNRDRIIATTTITQEPKRPQTAMSMAFQKALEKKNR